MRGVGQRIACRSPPLTAKGCSIETIAARARSASGVPLASFADPRHGAPGHHAGRRTSPAASSSIADDATPLATDRPPRSPPCTGDLALRITVSESLGRHARWRATARVGPRPAPGRAPAEGRWSVPRPGSRQADGRVSSPSSSVLARDRAAHRSTPRRPASDQAARRPAPMPAASGWWPWRSMIVGQPDGSRLGLLNQPTRRRSSASLSPRRSPCCWLWLGGRWARPIPTATTTPHRPSCFAGRSHPSSSPR